MKNKKEFSVEIAGKTLTIEVSSLAEQANAAVLAKYGETVVLATAVMGKKDVELDYLPLKVDYEEKFYAAGKIIGSRFIRREGRSSEEAILAGRLVDRTIRPLFDNRLRREMQVVVTVLQIDEQNDPEFVGLLGASTALLISDIPWAGPVAGVRIAQFADGFKINPDNSYVVENEPVFDAFLSGSKDRINMIELGGLDAQEKDIEAGFAAAQKEINKLIEFQEKIRAEIGKPKAEVKLAEPDPELQAAVKAFIARQARSGCHSSRAKWSIIRRSVFCIWRFAHHLKEKFVAQGKDVNWKAVEFLFDEAVNDIVHKNVFESERRPDGRKLDRVARTRRRSCDVFPHARLGHLRPRQHAGARRNDARCAWRRADDRNDGNDRQAPLHAALQLPAVLSRRNRHVPRSRPPRNRPWQLSAQIDRAIDPEQRRIPIHDPRRFRNHVVERFIVAGDRLRLGALDDGRRRAAEETGRRYRDGLDDGDRG